MNKCHSISIASFKVELTDGKKAENLIFQTNKKKKKKKQQQPAKKIQNTKIK